MNGVAIDWITELLLRTVAADDAATPRALTFLLRRYVATGRSDVSEALGPLLTRALERSGMSDSTSAPSDPEKAALHAGPADWLTLFVEAAGLSEDDRLSTVATGISNALRHTWPSRGAVMPALRSVDACLLATSLESSHRNVASAIDELERVVGLAYVPGEGLARTMNTRGREPGRLIDHAAAASTLLTAYSLAGRLPYPMLAEELMQFARRSWWDHERGGFQAETDDSPNDSFVANCEAARVLCRLAALHRDDDYRQAAVIAQRSDYYGDATRTLESLDDRYQAAGLDAASYGLALTELMGLR